jgi:DNA-binding MarR family transcriptional regulator
MATNVKSVQRAIRILDVLGRENGLGVSRISRQLNFPKSSVHEILATLEREGIVDKDADQQPLPTRSKTVRAIGRRVIAYAVEISRRLGYQGL